jgi:hypothetical protein
LLKVVALLAHPDFLLEKFDGPMSINPPSALTVTMVLLFSPAMANAAPHHYRYHQHNYSHSASSPYSYGAIAPQNGYGARAPSACISDYSPCDPVYFKRADNRCEGVIW